MRYSRLGYWGRQAAGVGLAFLAVALVIWVLPPNLTIAKYSILTIGTAASVAVILSAYTKADEVILQTHKTAWFWGCMAALVLRVPLTIFINLRLLPLPVFLPRVVHQPSVYFSLGVVAVLVLETAGFLAIWAYLNLRRRG